MHEHCYALVARTGLLGIVVTTSVLGTRLLGGSDGIHVTLPSGGLPTRVLVRNVVGLSGSKDQWIGAAVLQVGGNMPASSVAVAHSGQRVRRLRVSSQ